MKLAPEAPLLLPSGRGKAENWKARMENRTGQDMEIYLAFQGPWFGFFYFSKAKLGQHDKVRNSSRNLLAIRVI